MFQKCEKALSTSKRQHLNGFNFETLKLSPKVNSLLHEKINADIKSTHSFSGTILHSTICY